MNIKDAKMEICNTIKAYTRKNNRGDYLFPLMRQRPVFLVGPPGIGKTAIMEQISRECGIGLVSYTITHHTRQSAIGLPRIETKEYGGKTYSVTEYTMSEIIGSVYECIERTGHREGVLFIDEINCVSETLAPTILQFLQYKTFGSHKVPDGWVIVTAGNPSEYNKSVHEFDVATLDRVKMISVEADYDTWKEYAYDNQIHGAIISYLNIKNNHFYYIEQTADGKLFVTARGWEDLSQIMKSYEELNVPVTEELAKQYLQQPEIARDFVAYYQLYKKYKTDYKVMEILEGTLSEEKYQMRIRLAQNADFDERLTITGLLLGRLQEYWTDYKTSEDFITDLHQALLKCRDFLYSRGNTEAIGEFIKDKKQRLQVKIDTGIVKQEEEIREKKVIRKLEDYFLEIKKERLTKPELEFEKMNEQFQNELRQKKQMIEQTSQALSNGFAFLEKSFGKEQEMVVFVTSISRNNAAMEFIQTHGSKEYLQYSKELLFRQKEQELKKQIEQLQSVTNI